MSRKSNRKLRGLSVQARIQRVNEIYDYYARQGLSNREIWRRHVYPKFYISEATFNNYIAHEDRVVAQELRRDADQGQLF